MEFDKSMFPISKRAGRNLGDWTSGGVLLRQRQRDRQRLEGKVKASWYWALGREC